MLKVRRLNVFWSRMKSEESLGAAIAERLIEWHSPLLIALFGSDDPLQISQIVVAYVWETCDAAVERLIFLRAGVGAVFGLRLSESRSVVVKVHRSDLVGEMMDERWRLQRHLADRGMPVPRPVTEPMPLANGVATMEEYLGVGEAPDARLPGMTEAIATALQRFIAVASELWNSVELPLASSFGLPSNQLWATPHDLRFDFSAPGGEWIDDIARKARQELAANTAGEPAITHNDWRSENLRFRRLTLAAIYDMDSTSKSREPCAVGSAAHSFSTNWGDRLKHLIPTPSDSFKFLRAYEKARGGPFNREELSALESQYRYSIAYSARCEHSDVVLGLSPDRRGGWRSLLRKVADTPLLDNDGRS